MLKWMIVCVTVVSMLGVTGCCRKAKNVDEAAAEKIVERAIRMSTGNKAEVDMSGDSVQIKTKDGDMVMSSGAGAKLPETFPKDVPIYKGAVIIHAVSQADTAHSVTMQTKDSMEKVAEYYKTALTSKGWTEAQEINMPGQAIRGYEKGDRVVSVMTVPGDGQTHVNLSVGKR